MCNRNRIKLRRIQVNNDVVYTDNCLTFYNSDDLVNKYSIIENV
jgi:hypothetical protein